MRDLKGILKIKEPLAQYTTWHIGGLADSYFRPDSIEALSQFLGTLPTTEPITVLGLGSNVLISDRGIRGQVIHLLGKGSIELKEDFVRIEAHTPCAKIAKFCVKENLLGGTFFAGIPGTMGGALAMNAGAFGGETWASVVKLIMINRQGDIIYRSPSEFKVGYRTVEKPNIEEWFVGADFKFNKALNEIDNIETLQHQIKALLRKRNASQPIGVFSCGSVFKNPPGDHAARLIEASQLKGYRIGNAEISPKHANFIINLGNAKAVEIIQLMEVIQEKIFKDHQIYLEPEVKLLGF